MVAVVRGEPPSAGSAIPFVGPLRVGHEVVAGELIAAGTRDDVDRRAAGLRFTQRPGDLHVDFLRVRDIGDIAAGHPHDPGAAAGVDDRPIHHDAALVERFVGQRVDGEEGCWLGIPVSAQVVDVVVAPDADAAHAVRAQAGRSEPRRQGQDAADVARRRQIANVLARKRRDLTRVLHVHRRRLADDSHRVRDLADSHRRIDGSGKPGRQHDVVLLLLGEPLEREGHDIGANGKVGDSILPARIAGGRPDFFNERGACHFDKHSRYHAALGVAHGPGDVALLGQHRCRQQQ